MRIIIIGLIMTASFSSFAGEGSTMDFVLTAGFGYENGCKELDESFDKLRQTACSWGESMKKAGVNKKQFDEVLNVASENLPNFKSICN